MKSFGKYIKHFSYKELCNLLSDSKSLSTARSRKYKRHIDTCRVCWETWNRVRWDAAWTKRGTQELREYLGARFEKYFDSSWALADDWYAQNPKSAKAVTRFYKTTPYYLYNSMIFYESGDRIDLRKYYQLIKREFKASSVLDFGCGIGNDGLRVLRRGVDVFFADYASSPSVKFLKWRLKKRKYGSGFIKKHVIDIERQKHFPSVDMIWAIDVLEHMTEPLSVLDTISEQTHTFVFFTDADDNAGGRHPFHFEFKSKKLVEKLKRKGFNKVKDPLLSIFRRDVGT